MVSNLKYKPASGKNPAAVGPSCRDELVTLPDSAFDPGLEAVTVKASGYVRDDGRFIEPIK